MNLRRRHAWWALAVAPFVLVGAESSTHGESPGGGLFGRAFVSTAVVKDGEPHSLLDGTRIRLQFERRDDGDVVRWRAGCNYFGGRVDVRPRRLEIRRIEGTDVGCSKPLHEQDAWVAEFFNSDPSWERLGRRLKLRTGDDAIRLRRR